MLVGAFAGAARLDLARRAARTSLAWGVLTGAMLTAAMWASTDWVAAELVPAAAHGVFASAWWIAAVAQPLNAVSFVTDGIHWGSRHYAYMRNGMLAASAIGIGTLASVDTSAPTALDAIWWTTGLWITVRAVVGLARRPS